MLVVVVVVLVELVVVLAENARVGRRRAIVASGNRPIEWLILLCGIFVWRLSKIKTGLRDETCNFINVLGCHGKYDAIHTSIFVLH